MTLPRGLPRFSVHAYNSGMEHAPHPVSYSCSCPSCAAAQGVPTPEEIAERCAAIRATWSEYEMATRLVDDGERETAFSKYEIPMDVPLFLD